MTRFARARGSKSSNERAPEDSTPWEVMKEQLLQAKKESDDSKNRKEAEQKRIENYENFLKEQKVQKRKATWCDFPEAEKKQAVETDNVDAPAKKKKNKKRKPSNMTNHNINANKSDIDNAVETNFDNSSKKSKKKKHIVNKSLDNSQTLEVIDKVQNDQKIKNKKQKKLNNDTNSTPENLKPDAPQDGRVNNTNSNNEKKQNGNEQKKKKNNKFVDGKPVRRKEINDKSFQLIINGKEIELVRFDGFPVMKKDAERLQELKDSMIKKGIPKSEVQRTIKLERRRAEKALARVKRDVCYNCRKGGHVLSDCPELKSKIPGADGADGVCFKCGSTEHRQFECKVQRDKEFRFATCFICKEPGHIARQCPDNPKGLYPNGGSCKLCGDVTHLRKDCPTAMEKKEGSTVTLQTLDSGENIEDVGQQMVKLTPTETSKKPKKIRF